MRCRRCTVTCLTTALYSLLLSACASYPDALRSGYSYDFAARPMSTTQTVLGPGATLQIKYLRTPELNETQLVRPDGKISLPMLGDIDVDGLTPQQLRADLIKAYSGKLIEPDIRVLIQKPADRRIFVGGQVVRAGVFSMPGNMTALEAVMQAGGPDMRQACVENVLVIRHDEGKRQGYLVDLGRSLGGEDSKPFFLRHGDVVYVPRTTIAKVDQWIDQHINRVVPDVGVFFNKAASNGLTWGFQTAR